MELLYVWIEDYKNIHHQGFNFSPRYRFEFDFEKKELRKIQQLIGVEYLAQIIENHLDEMDKILFGKYNANKTTIERFVKSHDLQTS